MSLQVHTRKLLIYWQQVLKNKYSHTVGKRLKYSNAVNIIDESGPGPRLPKTSVFELSDVKSVRALTIQPKEAPAPKRI